jgi:signal transduction histidine kinase
MRSPSAGLQTLSKSQASVATTCFVALLVAASVKFVAVLLLAHLGTPPRYMEYQDAILTGILMAAFVWAFLQAARARQREQQQQIQVVADLHHNLRNALTVILASDYLRQTDKATAILEGVERIDRALQIILSDDQQ